VRVRARAFACVCRRRYNFSMLVLASLRSLADHRDPAVDPAVLTRINALGHE
jgi:hypothetical protein